MVSVSDCVDCGEWAMLALTKIRIVGVRLSQATLLIGPIMMEVPILVPGIGM